MEALKKRHSVWVATLRETFFPTGEFDRFISLKEIVYQLSKVNVKFIIGDAEQSVYPEYAGIKEVHLTIKLLSPKSTGHCMVKANAFNCFVSAMKQFNEEASIKMRSEGSVYFQPAADGTGSAYVAYSRKTTVKPNKKKSAMEELVAGLKAEGKPLQWEEAVEWLTLNGHLEWIDLLRSTFKDAAPTFEKADWQCKPVLDNSQKDGAKKAKQFFNGMVYRLEEADIQVPDAIPVLSDEDAKWLVIAYITMATWSHRQTDDGMFGLILGGQPNVGKSSMMYGIPHQKRVAGDAAGVGRFNIASNQTTLIFNDWTWDQLTSADNMTHVRNVALGESSSVKVHSTTKDVHAAWLVITTNDNWGALEQKVEKGELSRDHFNAQRRRFIYVEWKDVDVEQFDRISLYQLNKQYFQAYCLMQVFLYMSKNSDSCLWKYGPIRAYMKNIYKDCYDTAHEAVQCFCKNLKPIHLDFTSDTYCSSSEEIEFSEPSPKKQKLMKILGGCWFKPGKK